jgi:CYTH domain-containing protein
MIELEKTYLAKELPDLTNCECKDMLDIYLPASAVHPTLRIRKNGDKYEMTKKEPVEDDPSKQLEQTIPLTKNEFEELSQIEGKRVHKKRYLFKYQGRVAEFDVFQNDLAGLVLVDFEFEKEEEKDAFVMPSFCLVDITPELFIAGGMICGKSYNDVEADLDRFNYKKIDIQSL